MTKEFGPEIEAAISKLDTFGPLDLARANILMMNTLAETLVATDALDIEILAKAQKSRADLAGEIGDQVTQVLLLAWRQTLLDAYSKRGSTE